MFKAYRKLCDEKRFEIGELWLWKGPDQWVLNFPTKKHWRNPSKLSYVEAGLKKFAAQHEQRGIREAAFPRLGCGNGGLDWGDVRAMMEHYLSALPIQIYIHDYEKDIGLPEHRQAPNEVQFQRSFETFLGHLESVLYRARGNFVTVTNSSPYQALFDESKNLLIERSGRNSVVPNEELYELWTLLLRGPLTRRRLPGAARDSAYYIFPILAQLPYIRAIEVAQKDDTAALAVELLDQDSITQILPNGNGSGVQGDFEWA